MERKSIEYYIDHIADGRSREYFKEVMSSYAAENYRSAVVMLYSVVICDLIFKLRDLDELYGNASAKKILKEVADIQSNDPKSSKWESLIVERMTASRLILETIDRINIEALQQHRNLCAHPVLKDSESVELYRPNRPTVQSHILNMLQGVLTKHSIMTDKMFEDIVNDIDAVRDTFTDVKRFRQYLNRKYLDKINNPDIEYSFFKKLWKFIFKIDNDDTRRNRMVNLRALLLLLNRNTEYFLARIGRDADYYEQNTDFTIRSTTFCLLRFINESHGIYKVINQSMRMTLDSALDSNQEYRAAALFKVDNIEEHIKNCYVEDTDVKKYIYRQLTEKYDASTAIEYATAAFDKCCSFDEADSCFNEVIEPILPDMDMRQLEKLMETVNSNGQINCRRDAPRTNRIIRRRVQELQPDYDFSTFGNMRF